MCRDRPLLLKTRYLIQTADMDVDTPHPILHFCFTELTSKQHFAKDAALDETIRTRFGATLEAAARCELFAWRATPEGRPAEVLELDQFSRNVYRHKPQRPRAFAQDELALALAQELVASEQDRSLTVAQLCLHAQRVGVDS